MCPNFDDGTDTENEDLLNGNNQGPNQAGTQLNAGSGLASNTAPTAASSSSAPAGGKPTSSGSWTNLDSYLGANADQAASLGSSIASNVSGSATAAQGALQQNVADFNDQYSSIPTVDQASKQTQQILGDTANDTAGSDNVNQFQQFLNGNWTYNNGGTASSTPTSFQNINGSDGNSDYSKTSDAYNTAANNLTDTQTEAGRGTLLNSQYGSNGMSYGAGDQNLDQYLLEGNQGNQTTLNNVYSQYSPGIVPTTTTQNNTTQTTSPDLLAAENAATAYGANVMANEGTIQTNAQTALQGAIASGTASVNQENATAQAARDADYQAIAAALGSNSLSPAQLQALGLTSGMQLYGSTPGSYLSAEGTPLNINQTSSADDFARSAALQALASGQSYASTANLGLGSAQDTTIPSEYSYNIAALNQAVANNKSQLNNADQAVVSGFNANDGGGGNGYLPANASAADQAAWWQNYMNTRGAGMTPWNKSAIQSLLDQYNAAQSEYNPNDTLA